jgi:ribose transport system ATP-binding protein
LATEVISETQPTALEFRHLSKTFGGQKALADVHFHLRKGEVHGLLGQNGSGKSTLIKILAGYHAPDPGSELEVSGQSVALPLSPGRFHAFNISFVHQHLGLIPSLTVVENLLIGQIAESNALTLSWSREAERAATIFARYSLTIDPRTTVSRLSAVERALLAIIRAVEEMKRFERPGQAGILVLDEPTPFLPRQDVERLFALIRTIAAQGAGVIFVSHDVDEVLDITDRATVLRDGRVAGTVQTKATNKQDLVQLIVGRAVDTLPPKPAVSTTVEGSIVIDDLSAPYVESFSLRIGRGEVVGLTGLLGSGYEEIPYLLYGGHRATTGRLVIAVAKHDLTQITPRQAIANGIVLIPGDRATAGVIGSLPVVDNVTMPVLDTIFSAFNLPRRRMTERCTELGRRFDVTPNRPLLPISALSGGNAQKVVLAKWLQSKPQLILLDEPTQGVDVGARFKVFEAIRAAAANGATVICASSDYDQLATLCDRVLILSRGRIITELAAPHLSKETIAQACYHSTGQRAEAA